MKRTIHFANSHAEGKNVDAAEEGDDSESDWLLVKHASDGEHETNLRPNHARESLHS